MPVQVAGRFVADQKSRVRDNGAGNRHALLLAAGEFIGPVRTAIGQADQLQCDLGIALALRAVEPGQQQRQLDVLLRGQGGHEVVELEHETDVLAAPVRELAVAEAVDALAFYLDLATAGRVQPPDQVEQGGLAGARGPHQGDEIATRYFQVQTMQHGDLLGAALVGLAEVADGDQ